MSQLALKSVDVAPSHHGGRVPTRTNTKGSVRTGRQSNVLSRLQAFFPSNSPASPRMSMISAPVQPESQPTPGSSTRPQLRFLKTRIITWNMHDSLPKGNLEDLLGAVPPYVPVPEDENDKFRIPNMTIEDCHPYHIVVVAGQECPTVSGIPRGLGASFRHKEKDKHKDGEKSSRKGRGKDGKDKEDPSELEGSPPNGPSTPTTDMHSTVNAHGPTSGWSWILEEWFCRGLGQRGDHAETSSASELYNSQAMSASASAASESQPFSSLDSHSCVQCEGEVFSATEKDKKKKERTRKHKSCCRDKIPTGPYELLIKERLMGIYMAVFIYRDLKPLVRGVSKAAVTTGLIGGRVGNKGCVGISINLDGTTLLFLNAHLAAHEERKMNRVANIAKIKSELQVDDFLSQDDPRVMAEDFTDKFDYTFIFGDLNFRLNVTRLHADWLISRQAYDEALAFDQLRTLMKSGEAFVGFNEAPIRFPPTFKYDVMKSVKRDKSLLTRDLVKMRGKRWRSHLSNPNLSELEMKDVKDAVTSTRLTEAGSGSADELECSRGASMDTEDNGSSVSTSITATSVQSQPTADADFDESCGFFARPRYGNGDDSERATGLAAQKMFIAKAALKAKNKWMSMLKLSDLGLSAPRKVSKKRPQSYYAASSPQIPELHATKSHSSSAIKAASAIELGLAHRPSFADLRRSPSKKSTKSNKSNNAFESGKRSETSGQETEGGGYDSSNKQRVPSWCDRILWKSTVQPGPESEEDEALVPGQRSSFGPRVLHFFTQALKSRSARNRTASLSSVASLPAVEVPPPLPPKDISQSLTETANSPLLPSPGDFEEEPVPLKIKSFASVVSPHCRHPRKARAPILLKSKSIEPTSNMPPSLPKQHGYSQSVVPVISAPLARSLAHVPADAELKGPEETPLPPRDLLARQSASSMRGWRFFPFFGREAGAPDSDTNMASPTSTQHAAAHRPRRGEIVVLDYRSLDDQAMRRLEGRSDHRPVIGSYAIYI